MFVRVWCLPYFASASLEWEPSRSKKNTYFFYIRGSTCVGVGLGKGRRLPSRGGEGSHHDVRFPLSGCRNKVGQIDSAFRKLKATRIQSSEILLTSGAKIAPWPHKVFKTSRVRYSARSLILQSSNSQFHPKQTTACLIGAGVSRRAKANDTAPHSSIYRGRLFVRCLRLRSNSIMTTKKKKRTTIAASGESGVNNSFRRRTPLRRYPEHPTWCQRHSTQGRDPIPIAVLSLLINGVAFLSMPCDAPEVGHQVLV